MRKSILFSAVLSLFLHVPASITWAQTATLTGVVYENNITKIPFNLPQGKITFYLPADMAAGDPISGTVMIEPGGKNEKEKLKNFDALKKYRVAIGRKTGSDELYNSGSTPLVFASMEVGSRFGFVQDLDVCVTATCSLHFSIGLNNQIFTQAEIPLVQPRLTDEKFLPGDYQAAKKIISDDEQLAIRVPAKAASLDPNWYINGKEIHPFCSSSRQTVMTIPAGTKGKTNVTAKDRVGNIVYTEEIYVVSIHATIDKQNLQKGEMTDMFVSLDGIQGCPYPLSMTIVNHSPQTITLERGAHQTYPYNPGNNMPLTVKQAVTGVIPGQYDIMASLILPSIAYGDVFDLQKSSLKSTEDYNAWVEALKKDLKFFMAKQGNDEVGKAAKASAQRAIDNISTCDDKNKLDKCKAFAVAYLRPLKIPATTATLWLSGFEAYKAAVKAIIATINGKAEPIDWEQISNGIEFIRNRGEILNDKSLQDGANNAKTRVETIKKSGETIEQLVELKDTLYALNESINNKFISGDPGLSDRPPIQFEQKELPEPRKLEDKALQTGLHVAIKKLIADAAGARGQAWNTVCDNCRGCIEARLGEWAEDLVRDLGEGIIKEYLGKAVDLIGEAVKAVGAAKEFFDKISNNVDKAEKLADDIADKIKKGELQVMALEPKMCKNSYCLIRGTVFYNPKTGCVFAILYCEGSKLCCPEPQNIITLNYCTNENGMPANVPDIDVIKK
jgi:hypothetical protein